MTAVGIYGGLLWAALSTVTGPSTFIPRMRPGVMALTHLVPLTILSGAFVAGNRAGV